MSTIERGVFVTDEFRDEIRELAWRQRTSMSSLVGVVIEQFITDPTVAEVWPKAPPSGPAKLNASVDPRSWDAAREVAHESRAVLSQVIRSGLAYHIEQAKKGSLK